MAGDQREKACLPVPVPIIPSAVLDGYRWAHDQIGESGGAVYRLHGGRDPSDLFLKLGQGSVADDITDEMVRLRWLGDHVPVPLVRHFARNADQAALLMTAVPGTTAFQRLEADPEAGVAVVDALVDFLRGLHAISIETCPFDSDHRIRLVRARKRIDAGLVDTEDFDDERAGWSAERVWTEMEALLPLVPDRVVTHGDFSLDNILMQDGRVTGCIDVGRAGVADRYQDLALLWNCLGAFDPTLGTRMFERYGLDTPNREKLRFHLMLDELF